MNDYKNEFVTIKNKSVISNFKINVRNVSICELIFEKLNENPEKEVLIDSDKNKVWKAKDILDSSLKLCTKFLELGVMKGDIIAVQAPNSDYQVIVYLAVVSIGAVYTGCMHNAPINELKKVIKDTKPSYLIISQDKYECWKHNFRDYKNVKRIFALDTENHYDELLSISKLIKEVPFINKDHIRNVIARVNGNDPLQIVFSSGTTGTPKPVLLSHRNLTSDFEETSHFYNIINSDDTVALYFPLYHVAGSIMLSLCLYATAKCCIFTDDTDEKIFEMCHKYNVTSIHLVPSLVNAFNEMYSDDRMLSLKKVVSTGDHLPARVAHKFIEMFKLDFFTQLYGTSEVITATLNPYSSGVSDFMSIGFPFHETICKVVDIESNEDLDVNEIGEIRIKSPKAFQGYFNNTNATQQVFDENGFYKTGDFGYYDENGKFYFVRRQSSIIKHDGWCISPLELELILLEHDYVQEAAVLGIDAGILGEVPKAFVILRKNCEIGVSIDDLIEFVNSKVVYYKKLRGGVEILKSFPRTTIGKIDRKALKEYKNNQ